MNEPPGDEPADRLFERRWVLALLEHAMQRLEQECTIAGKLELFNELRGFVSGEKGMASYAEAAAKMNLSSSMIKTAIFRLRRRYHDLVREEVGRTVANPGELKEELRHLMSLFDSG